MRAAAPAARATNLRAAGLTVAAVALFAFSDTIIKLLTGSYPPGQIMFCRGLFALLLLAPALSRSRGPLPWRDRAAWVRSGCEFVVGMCFFQALAALPLAEATAVLFLFPVFLTLLGALVLREAVCVGRWAAVALGLAGVLLILRPGTAAFDPGAGWALAAAMGVAARDFVTRYLRPETTTEGVAFLTTGVTTLGALATWPLLEPWSEPDAPGVAGFAASAVLVSTAFLCLVAGTRRGDVSFTAPFRYVTVPLTFLLGWLVWGGAPDGPVVAGAALIVAAGLLNLSRRERG